LKLPPPVQARVQPLGRYDINAPIRAASAEAGAAVALSQAVGQGADFVTKLIGAEYEEKIKQRTVEIKSAMDEARRTIVGTASWNVDDPRLKNAKYAKANPDGSIRTQVDGSEIQSQLWAQSKQKINETYLSDFSDGQKSRVKDSLAEFTRSSDERVLSNGIAKTNTRLRNTSQATAEQMVDAGDLLGAIEHVRESTPWTDAEKAKLTEGLRLRDERRWINDSIRSVDSEQIMTSISLLDDQEYSGQLSESERQASLSDMRGRLDELRVGKELVRTRAHEEYISDIELGVRSGNIKVSNIEAAYQRGKENPNDPNSLSPKERTRLRIVAESTRKRGIDTAIDHTFVNRALTGQALVNPADNKHVKAVQSYAATLEDPRELENLVVKTGVMPQEVQNRIEGQAINGTTQQAIDGLMLYGRLSDTASHLLHGLDKRADNIYNLADVMVRGGVEPATAINVARETLKTAPEQVDARKEYYREEKPDNLDALEDFMDADERLFDIGGMWTADVDPTIEMGAEYDAMVNGYYMSTGNLDEAQKMAYNAIQRTWGISATGGRQSGLDYSDKPRAMKYAPERVLNINARQSNNALKAFAAANDIDAGKVIIHSDAVTAREPSWGIATYNEETGLIDVPLGDDMQPLRWKAGDWIKSGQELDIRERTEAAVKKRDRSKEGEHLMHIMGP